MNDINQIQTKFIGAWRLLSCQYFDDAHHKIDYMGTHPKGVLVYGPDGTMTAQLMNEHRERFQTEDWAQGSLNEIKDAFTSYQAYFGTYEIDKASNMIKHHVQGALFPNWHLDQSVQIRHFHFEGNRLRLSTNPILLKGVTRIFELWWEKTY